MRIRKRSSSSSTVSMAPPATVTQQQQPISYKYQTCSPREGRRRLLETSTSKLPECSNMQSTYNYRCLDHEAAPASRSDVNHVAEPPVTENRRLSDAHVKDEPGPVEDAIITDKGRRKQSSPTKRRKIEHDSSLNLFEGPSSMTAAELLAVNELANGVRQRLAAAPELSTSEQEKPPEKSSSKPPENSKDALISSIFYVFDTHGDHGLSASEVVKFMIDQRLPGLKEGGARHTVQVANVLRSSSSFFSLGDKKYLLCATVDNTHPATESKKPNPKITAGDDSSENELAKSTNPKRSSKSGSKSTPQMSNTRTGKKVQAEKPKEVTPESNVQEGERDGGTLEAAVVRVARRRGPSSSQKGKGPTQCKRYDGRGWQCSRLTEPGYSLCVHHQDLINKRAAKLKEQQTLSRLMESVQRKAKSSGQTALSPAAAGKEHSSLPAADAAAPTVQKRKMLSLQAINK